MHIITRDRIVYSFSRDHRPVQEVNSGDRIRFETYDARTGTILSETDLILPNTCLLYTSPSPRDRTRSRMPSSA